MSSGHYKVSSPVELTVYGRKDCHLCHDMIAGLNQFRQQSGFDFDVMVIDIDTEKDLVSHYGERIPVLMAGGEEICHYRLDPAALDAYFARIG